MKKTLLILLFPLIAIGQTQIGSDIDGEAAGDYNGYKVALSADGSVVAISATYNDGNGSNSGSVRVFKNVSGTWNKVGADIDGEFPGDNSGTGLAISSDGNIVAIGANVNSSIRGSVRIYQNISGTWTQIGADIDGEAVNDASGSSVSLSSDGTIVAIGAPYNDGNGSNSGSVRVYKNVSGTWTQIGADIDGESFSDQSGWSVALSSDGSILAIGNQYNDGGGVDSGSARVYKNVSGTWIQIGTDINGEAAGDNSGSAVSLSSDGSIIAIGARQNDGNGIDSGSVRVYKNVSGTWTKIGSDIDGEAAGDKSGATVTLSADGNIIAIGSPSNDGNGTDSGSVRVYKNISGSWTQIGADIDGEAPGNFSSYSASLSSDGSVLAIGVFLNSGNGIESGHVRVYNLSTVLSSDSFVLSNFSIYPNPVSDIVNISLSENLELEKVNVYNTLGQLVKTEKSNAISVNSLSYGTYYFEIITDKGKGTKTVLVK